MEFNQFSFPVGVVSGGLRVGSAQASDITPVMAGIPPLGGNHIHEVANKVELRG